MQPYGKHQVSAFDDPAPFAGSFFWLFWENAGVKEKHEVCQQCNPLKNLVVFWYPLQDSNLRHPV